MSDLWKASFLDLHRQVDEMFEELIYRPWAIGERGAWRPALDLYETAEVYLVEIDLPGLAPEEVQFAVSERGLTISGKRSARAPEKILSARCERPCGPFHRALALAQPIDPGKVEAEYRHGTYRLRLPKKPLPEALAPETSMEVGETQYVVQVTVSDRLEERP